jgi:hypothetical protein
MRRALEEGASHNLPGAGKPLPDLTEGYDPDWWAKRLVRREGVNLQDRQSERPRPGSEAAGTGAERERCPPERKPR